MPSATQLKKGNTIIINGDLFRVAKLTHITPGKGNAVVQCEMRNVKTGVKTEKRFRSSENVDIADVTTRSMQYLYEADGVYNFMDTENYSQYELSHDLLGDSLHFLVQEANYDVELHDNFPIGITLPQRVTLKIIQTDPPEKGAQGKTKPATLSTGFVVKVPLFMEEGTSIVIDTESKEYVERA